MKSNSQQSYKLKHFKDVRTQQEQQQQFQKIKQLNDLNFERYGLPQFKNIIKSKKPQEQKLKYNIKKQIFADDGVYCYYTDNIDDCPKFQSSIVIFTITGLPGTHREWRFLHKAIGYNYCRWINFVPPGGDKEDERRGNNYKGTIFEVCDLIQRLLNHLKIGKVVILAHSFGTFPANVFTQKYPERVIGLAYLGSPALTAHTFLAYFYQKILQYFQQNNLDYSKRIDYLNSDHHREKLYQMFLQGNDKLELSLRKAFNYNINEYMYIYKIYFSYQNEFQEYFDSVRQYKQPILRFIAGGSMDNIIDPILTQEMLYFFTFGQNSWFNLSSNIKYSQQTIDKIGKEQQVNLNLQDLQQNFAFYIEDAPHLIHIYCTDIITKPIKCYLKVVEHLDQIKQNQQLQPKL